MWRFAPSGRKGFTLLEVIVAVAIIATLAAVLLTRTAGQDVRGRTAALAASVDALSKATATFRGDVGRYPSLLTYLAGRPPSGATDPCGRTIPDDAIALWKGPYTLRGIQANGIVIGSSTIQNRLRRASPDPLVTYSTLFVDVHEVDRAVAEGLERTFDGPPDADYGRATSVSSTTGTILFNDSLNIRRGRLSFGVPVAGC